LRGLADLTAFVVALGITWAVTPAILRFAVRFGAVAVPRSRDVHDTTTPRWGGIAIYIGVVAAVLITVTIRHLITHGVNGWNWHIVGVLVAGTLIALIGIVDDLRDLRAIYQVIGILASGAVLIAFGVRIEGLSNPFVHQTAGAWHWFELSKGVSIALTLFWVFLVTKRLMV
jgi:UDP-GlcNAc:undecaprenyl-phosphate GlcNAc-1-phosphate transferase